MSGRGRDRRSGTGYIHTRYVEHDGVRRTLHEWRVALGLSRAAILERARKLDAGLITVAQAVAHRKLPRGVNAIVAGQRARREPISQLMASMFDVPYVDDEFAQMVVERHAGGGLELDRIGELYGISRERVRQLEQSAMRRIRAVCGKNATRGQIVELLRAIDAERRVNTNTGEMEPQIEYRENDVRRGKPQPRKAKEVAP